MHWPPPLRRLAGSRVIALDLPGHGRSGGAASSSLGEYAQSVVRLINHLNIERGIFIGHSMGSAIAQTLALDYSERVAGLVLVGAGARLKVAPQILEGIQVDFPSTVETVVERSYGPAVPQPLKRLARRRMLELDSRVLYSDFLACDHFDETRRVSRIAAPTLVVVGSADRMTPEKYARSLADNIPQAELEVFPEAGHMLMLERPEEFSGTVREFVTRCR